MKGRNVSLNNIPNMYKHHSWIQTCRHVSAGETGNSAAHTGSLCVKVQVLDFMTSNKNKFSKYFIILWIYTITHFHMSHHRFQTLKLW